MLVFKEYSEISSNYARQVIKAQSSSFVFMYTFAIVNISHNAVYNIIKQVSTSEKHAVPICPLQGHIVINHFEHLQLDAINCTLLLLHNTQMISKILPTDIISYIINKKCTWLEDTIFQKIMQM